MSKLQPAYIPFRKACDKLDENILLRREAVIKILEADIQDLIAERDQIKRVLAGLPDGAIDGGWTAKGIIEYAASLEKERDLLKARLAEIEETSHE